MNVSCLYAEYWTHHTGHHRIPDLIRVTFVWKSIWCPYSVNYNKSVRLTVCAVNIKYLAMYVSCLYGVYNVITDNIHRIDKKIKWERIFYVRAALKGRSKNKGGRRWLTKIQAVGERIYEIETKKWESAPIIHSDKANRQI